MPLLKWVSVGSAIVFATWTLSNWQHTIQDRIEKLYLQSQSQHENTMLKLNAIESEMRNYALKKSVIDITVYTSKLRDERGTNKMILDEMEFRRSLQEFFK